ncbi:hypothetical protein EV126DRAFT_407432 [Verticillium dahliae]|nr:hypothetical protein EV126DRAFT_407432 [Verticillium dahliae]
MAVVMRRQALAVGLPLLCRLAARTGTRVATIPCPARFRWDFRLHAGANVRNVREVQRVLPSLVHRLTHSPFRAPRPRSTPSISPCLIQPPISPCLIQPLFRRQEFPVSHAWRNCSVLDAVPRGLPP